MTIGLGNYIRIVKPGVYVYWCPGCDKPHQFNISSTDHPAGKRWGWNGNLEAPSVDKPLEFDGCSHELRGGILHYTADCAHALAGKQAPLPVFPMPDRLCQRTTP
jgi:hypothetical protein